MKTRIDKPRLRVVRVRAFLSTHATTIAMVAAGVALGLCATSWYFTYKIEVCVKYALGDVSVSPPEYCFAKLDGSK